MSTWGGIGEGLTAGMNARIALEEQRRREDLAQSNWQKHFDLRKRELDRRQQETDQEFQFKREQAERAQENADRTFEAGREDAANANERANADLALRQRLGDLDANIKQQDMYLRGELGALDAEIKTNELADRKEDRVFRRDMQKEQLAGQREDRALRRELGTAELEGKKEDRTLRREEFRGRREDAAADRAFREREATRNQGNVEADRSLKREQIQAMREDAAADRAIRERGLDLQEARDERADNFRDRQFNESVLQADLEYKLKKEAQDWANRINEQRVTEAKLNADKMRMSLEREKQKSDAVKATGQKQIGQAVYNMLAWKDSGLLKKTTIYETQPDGSERPMEVLAMPESSLRDIFGTDGDLSSIRNMYIVETNEGPRIGIQKWDEEGNATSVLLDEGGMYSALEKGFQDKDFATQTMRDFADKRSLGMFREQENIRADARIREVRESGRGIGAASTAYQTGLNNIDELIPLPMKGEAGYDAKLKEAEIKRAQFREGYMKLLGSIGVENAYAGESKIEVPSNTYKVIGPKGVVAGIRTGSVRMQNGRVLAPGQKIDTPEGTLVNENGKVYLISK